MMSRTRQGMASPRYNDVHGQRRLVHVVIVSFVLLALATPIMALERGMQTADGGPDPVSRGPVHEIKFDGPGRDQSFEVELLKDRRVSSFHMNIEGFMGAPTKVNKDFTYAPQSSNLLHWGTANVQPPQGDPLSFEENNATGIDFGNLTSPDGKYITHSIQVSNTSQNMYIYQHFGFVMDLSGPVGAITSLPRLNVTWEGFGENAQKGDGYKVWLFIWNFTSSTWRAVGAPSDPTGSNDLRAFRSFNMTETADLIEGLRRVHLLVIGSPYTTGGPSTDLNLSTDYVALNVSWEYFSFPSNLEMDIGADGDIEWARPGPLERFDGQIDLRDDPLVIDGLHTLIDGLGDGPGNITVPVRFTSASAGGLRINNFTIGYEPLGEPSFKPFPQDLSFPEDTVNERALDLWDFSTDEFGAPNLTFSVVHVRDPVNVTVSLNPDGHHLDFKALANWSGATYFRVKAENRFGIAVESTDVGISFLPVNDPPVISPIGDMSISEREHLTLGLEVFDIEDDVLTFRDETDLFDVDPTTGVIDFVPMEEDDGSHIITVLVSDGEYEVSETFQLDVVEVDDPPVFDWFPAEVEVVEDWAQDLEVTARDPEGDRVSYSVEPVMFEIDPDTGIIHLDPDQESVGVHHLMVTASAGNLSSELAFNLTVLEVNDPPEIREIRIISVDGDDNLKEGVGIRFEVGIVDEEGGNDLGYEWRTNMSTVLSHEASFVTTLPAGHQLIVLKVLDHDITVERIVPLFVDPGDEDEGGPGAVTPPVGTDDDTGDDGWARVAPVAAGHTAIVLVLGGLGVLVVTIAGTEVGKAKFFFFIAPLFSRINKEMALDSFTRGKIYGAILSNPGISYNTLKRITGVANGTLAHHLKVLERTGYVVFHRDGVYKKFYPMTKKLRVLKGQRVLSDIERAILSAIRNEPGITQSKVARRLSVRRQMVNYYIKKMRKSKFIILKKTGNRTKCFVKKENPHGHPLGKEGRRRKVG